MNRIVPQFTLAAFVAIGSAVAEDKENTPQSLEGRYTIISGEEDGQPIPEDRFKGTVVTFKGDRVSLVDKDKKEFFAATFQLDTSVKPWKIMMTGLTPKKGEKSIGVIEKEDDRVRLCYALPGGEPPTEFKAGGKQQCFVMKRLAK